MDIIAIEMADSYKVGMSKLHKRELEDGTKVDILGSYSNFTPRKNAYMTFCEQSDGKIIPYGARHTFQYVVDLFNETFFSLPLEKSMRKMKRLLKAHFGTIKEHKDFLASLEELHGIGFLPLEVRALDEGVRLNIGIPMFTVRSTVDHFGWLVNYIETLTSCLIWPMTNTATKIDQFYQQAKHYGYLSAPAEIVEQWLPVSVHEFGMRGYWGPEAAIRVSSAHSLFFDGSDTMAVLSFFEKYYGLNMDTDASPVKSVRASEHADVSRLLSEYRYRGITEDTEKFVMKDLAEGSTGIMSYVADTENYYRTINEYGAALKDVILNRKDREDGQPAIWVFRPDSGRRSPLTVICGYKVMPAGHGSMDWYIQNLQSDECVHVDGKYYINERGEALEISKEEALGSLNALWDTFGGQVLKTPAGEMKFINPKVSLIYGEAISQVHQKEIYERMIEMGFSVVNVLMGKGSYATLENNTRDLFSMAYKQTFSEASIDGDRVNLEQQKNPLGDNSKKSAKGLLRVELEDGMYVLYQEQTEEQAASGELKLLMRNGEFYKDQSIIDIRQSAQLSI